MELIRGGLQSDSRPTLDKTIIMHLGLTLGDENHLCVHRIEDHLEILTIDYRNKQIAKPNSKVNDLLGMQGKLTRKRSPLSPRSTNVDL